MQPINGAQGLVAQVHLSSATLAIQPLIHCQRRFREINVESHRTKLRILATDGCTENFSITKWAGGKKS
jgi:hypothetical protein